MKRVNKLHYWRPPQMVGAPGASEAIALTHIQ